MTTLNIIRTEKPDSATGKQDAAAVIPTRRERKYCLYSTL